MERLAEGVLGRMDRDVVCTTNSLQTGKDSSTAGR